MKKNLFLITVVVFIYLFFFFIEFIRVALVNTITQVPGAQFHNTSSVHCIVCSLPQVKSLSVTIYPSNNLFHLLSPSKKNLGFSFSQAHLGVGYIDVHIAKILL